MNRRKKGKNRKLFKKESRSNYKLGCIITIIILIPILYGVYLYCQGIDTSQKEKSQTSTSFQTSSDQKPENKKPEGKNPTTKELEIPVSLTRRQEQIIHHTGYTVSYNKDLKLPNWVSYELTRKETKGKEKRSNRFITDPQVRGLIATNTDYAHSGYDKGHMESASYERIILLQQYVSATPATKQKRLEKSGRENPELGDSRQCHYHYMRTYYNRTTQNDRKK